MLKRCWRTDKKWSVYRFYMAEPSPAQKYGLPTNQFFDPCGRYGRYETPLK